LHSTLAKYCYYCKVDIGVVVATDDTMVAMHTSNYSAKIAA
jgi:hypothetical protein